jgi:hypothetical protein
MAMRRCGLLLGVLAACVTSCAKKKEAPRRTEPWLASASASSSPAPRGAVELVFSSNSRIRFSLPTRKAKLAGEVPLAEGKLRLDLGNLEASKASISADLTRIAIADDSLPTEAEALPGSPSALALNWLELGPEVAAEKRSQFTLARFELVSIENLSKPSLDLEVSKRTTPVRATAVGTLLVHGYRAPVRAEVWLSPLPPSPSHPVRLSIRSATPLVLPLAPHDIVARGASGMPDALQMARAADVVGKNARIELELVAESSN